MHSEGRYRSVTAKHEYHFKDHLGNTRLVYCDLGTTPDGKIDVATEILQESHYYPYGLEYQGHYIQQSGYDYRYKFNDIERLKDLDIGIDMAFYRGLDPTTGRWMQVDPKAELMHGLTPYAAMGNNPVLHTDPNGDALPLVVFAVAAAIGGVGNLYSNWGSTNSFADGLSYFVNGAVGGAVSVVNPLAGAAITGGANLVTDAINGTLSNAIADGRLVEHLLWSAVEGVGVSGSGSAANNLAARFGWVEFGSIGQLSASEIAALQLPKGTELTTTLAPTAHAQKVVTSLPSGVANASKAVSNLSTSSLNPTHYITKSKTTMQTLLNDIRANGIQESIKYVENNGVKYIVDGHHRFYAAQRLRIQNVPVQQVQLPYGGYKNIMDLMMEPGKQPGFWNFLK